MVQNPIVMHKSLFIRVIIMQFFFKFCSLMTLIQSNAQIQASQVFSAALLRVAYLVGFGEGGEGFDWERYKNIELKTLSYFSD